MCFALQGRARPFRSDAIIKRRHQLRRRVPFILADLIVLPILSIYHAALRISDGANSRREQLRLDDYPNL